MATVTLAVAGIPRPIPFENPVMRAGSQAPGAIGKIVYTAAFTIIAKAADDETHVIFTCTLPTGFYYRCNFIEWTVVSTALAAFDGSNGINVAAGGLITENQVTAYNFLIGNVAHGDQFNGSDGVKTQPDSVTNDFRTFYRPFPWNDVQQYFIDAAQGVSILQIDWMDTSSSVTSAIPGSFRAEFFRYTVEQASGYLVQSPALVVG